MRCNKTTQSGVKCKRICIYGKKKCWQHFSKKSIKQHGGSITECELDINNDLNCISNNDKLGYYNCETNIQKNTYDINSLNTYKCDNKTNNKYICDTSKTVNNEPNYICNYIPTSGHIKWNETHTREEFKGKTIFELQYEDITALGFKMLKEFACGLYGCTILAQNISTKEKLVIKFGKIEKSEIDISIFAGKHGIGPIVYSFGKIKNSDYIIMEKLDGTVKPIYDTKSFTIQDGNNLVNLAIQCINLNLYHGDLHVNNIMYKSNGKTRQDFRLIDFGESSFRNEKKVIDEWLNVFKEFNTVNPIGLYDIFRSKLKFNRFPYNLKFFSHEEQESVESHADKEATEIAKSIGSELKKIDKLIFWPKGVCKPIVMEDMLNADISGKVYNRQNTTAKILKLEIDNKKADDELIEIWLSIGFEIKQINKFLYPSDFKDDIMEDINNNTYNRESMKVKFLNLAKIRYGKH